MFVEMNNGVFVVIIEVKKIHSFTCVCARASLKFELRLVDGSQRTDEKIKYTGKG